MIGGDTGMLRERDESNAKTRQSEAREARRGYAQGYRKSGVRSGRSTSRGRRELAKQGKSDKGRDKKGKSDARQGQERQSDSTNRSLASQKERWASKETGRVTARAPVPCPLLSWPSITFLFSLNFFSFCPGINCYLFSFSWSPPLLPWSRR